MKKESGLTCGGYRNVGRLVEIINKDDLYASPTLQIKTTT